MSKSLSQTMWVWSKLASSKWEDAWFERLRFLDPQCLVVTALPGKSSIRIEAYRVDEPTARILEKSFGGSVRETKADAWQTSQAHALQPILIRDRLVLAPDADSAAALRAKYPDRHVLLVPGSLAFGTGDHPTTATCLRWLVDFAAETEPGWSHLDAGTGTGVLCLAAKVLGAGKTEGFDFDPQAIRTAKINAEANQIAGVQFHKRDIRGWEPQRLFALVTANLYSGLLVESAAKLLRSLQPGGRLLLSGIMRSQEADVVDAFRKLGRPNPECALRKGKWVTLRY